MLSSIFSLLAAALPAVLQIAGWFISKSNASNEAKARFFEFVKMAGQDTGSVRLMEYGDNQLAWLKSQPDWKEST